MSEDFVIGQIVKAKSGKRGIEASQRGKPLTIRHFDHAGTGVLVDNGCPLLPSMENNGWTYACWVDVNDIVPWGELPASLTPTAHYAWKLHEEKELAARLKAALREAIDSFDEDECTSRLDGSGGHRRARVSADVIARWKQLAEG